MLNYDAFVRLIELHSRRSSETSSAHGRIARGLSSSSSGPWSAKMAGVADGGEAGGAVGGSGGGCGGAGLSKEKAMKVWLLEQPLFSSRGLNR